MQTLSLDSVLSMTRGNPLGVIAVLSHLDPAHGIYTGVCEAEGDLDPFIGQIRYVMGSRAARMSFLGPTNAINALALPALLEHLAVQAGAWGAYHLLAEVDEHNPLFESFRQAGFSIYSWQRVWLCTHLPEESMPSAYWRDAEAESPAVRSLVQSVVPALLQPMETPPSNHPQGWLARNGNGDVIAYVEIIYGPRGIWLQPYIHPAAENVPALLLDLLRGLPHRYNRPVYLCVRSYQAWLESTLQEVTEDVSPRQAVMVKHLAVQERIQNTVRIPTLENVHTETTAPVARSETHSGQ